MSLIVIPIT